jgi:Arc/MetJ family transcription regulator
MDPEEETRAGIAECVCDVYGGSVARTNIDIDEDAVKRVMLRYGFTTMKEAVNFALNRAAPVRATVEEMLAAEGIGWEGNLEEMRGQK